MNKKQLIAAVFGLVLLIGGFAAGMAIGKSGDSGTGASGAGAPAAGAPGGPGGFPGGAPGGAGNGAPGIATQGAGGQQFAIGRVVSVNDTTLTLEVSQPGQPGSSPTVTTQIVLLGSSTRVARTTETLIKASDLTANDQVQVAGTSDSSGRISANAVVVGSSTLLQAPGQGTRPSGSPSPTR